MDSITFAEFCQKLTEKLKKQDEDKLHGADTLPMKSLLKLDDEKDNLNKDSKPDDDILKPPRDEDDPDRLGFDGNYLKPKIESDIWQQFEDEERKRNNHSLTSSPAPPPPPPENESRSRNSLSLFQDALSISPPPEEIDLTDAIKTVLNKSNDWCVSLYVHFYIFVWYAYTLLITHINANNKTYCYIKLRVPEISPSLMVYFSYGRLVIYR